jgi:Flp pilus assembly protein TadD
MELDMSVVNQMLRDLDDRKVGEEPHSGIYQPSRNNSRSILVTAMIVFFVVLVGTLGWLTYIYSSVKPIEIIAPEQVKSTSSASVSVDAEFEAPQLAAELKVVAPRASRPVIDQTPTEFKQRISINTNNHDVRSINPTQQKPQINMPNLPAQTQNSNLKMQMPTEQIRYDTDKSSDKKNQSKQVSVTRDFSKQASGVEKTATSLQDQAFAALRSGQDALGIELLSKLIKLEPENIAVAKKLAAVLYSKNQSIRATAVLEESIRVSPQDPSLRLMLARLLVKSNDSIRALAIITPPSPLGSESIEFLGFRAALAERLGNYEVAYDDYTRLSRVQRNESRWWLGLAISSERVEAYQMATEAYQRVIALDQLGAEVKSFAQQRINQLVRIQ